MIEINKNFHLPDEEKIEQILQSYYYPKTTIKVNWGDVVDFINNQKNTIFYLTREFELEKERGYFTNYILLDTGLVSDNNKPIFLSFIDNGEETFSSRFVVDTDSFARLLCKNAPQKTKVINTNKSQFEKSYIHIADKRYLEHLPTPIYEEDEVKVTSETGKEKEEVIVSKDVTASEIETSSIKIPNEDVRNIVLDLSQAESQKEKPKETKSETIKEVQNKENARIEKTDTPKNDELLQDVMGILLSINWSKEELSSTLDDIGYLTLYHSNSHEILKQTKPFYYAIKTEKKVLVNTGILNLFGDDIYVIYEWEDEKNAKLFPTKLISSKNELLKEGFSIREASVFGTLPTPCFKKTISFYKNDNLDEICGLCGAIEEMCKYEKKYCEDFGMEMLDFTEKFNSSFLLSVKKFHADNSFGKYAFDESFCRAFLTLPIYIKENKEPDYVVQLYEDGVAIQPYEKIKHRFKTLQPYAGEW